MAMMYIPSPSAVSFLQILFATVVVLAMKYMGYPIDWFEWEKVKAYSVYIVLFVFSIYTNMKALEYFNVETVIVFRACSPLAVAMIEYFFMDREFPSIRSSLSLLGVVIGALMYCMSDSQLSLYGISAYTWVLIYFVLITLEMTYGKKLTSTVKMESVWGPVLYCNALSVVPMFLLGYAEGGFIEKLSMVFDISFGGFCVVLFSCIVGTLIGYTGWLCRGMVSATTYTLVGVVNKFLTVLLNVFIWDKHSTAFGIVSVLICLGAGTFYQQARRVQVEKREPVQRQQPLQ